MITWSQISGMKPAHLDWVGISMHEMNRKTITAIRPHELLLTPTLILFCGLPNCQGHKRHHDGSQQDIPTGRLSRLLQPQNPSHRLRTSSLLIQVVEGYSRIAFLRNFRSTRQIFHFGNLVSNAFPEEVVGVATKAITSSYFLVGPFRWNFIGASRLGRYWSGIRCPHI